MESSALVKTHVNAQMTRSNRTHVLAAYTCCARDNTTGKQHPQATQCCAQPPLANSRLLTQPVQAFQQHYEHSWRHQQQQKQQQQHHQTPQHTQLDQIISSRDTSANRNHTSNPTTTSSNSNWSRSRSSSSGQQQKLPQASSSLGPLPTTPATSESSSSSSSSLTDGPDSQASVMVCFLSAYGLQPADIDRLAAECPQLFACSSDVPAAAATAAAGTAAEDASDSSEEVEPPYIHEASGMAAVSAAAAAAVPGGQQQYQQQQQCTSVYEVGRVLLFFHSLGWSHSSVLRRIVALYPQLLTKQVERDILPVLHTLTDMGCSPDDLQLLVWEFPRIFCSSNWRRHIRKFQYLGLYGLPAPGHTSSRVLMDGSKSGSNGGSSGSSGGSSTDSTDSLERLLHWL